MKIWVTAYDERVCPICSQMDEEKRTMDEPFSNGKMLPPGHPSCRCAAIYDEIPGTNLNPAAMGQTAGGMRATSEDLQLSPDESILSTESALGKEGDTDGYTTIAKVEPFDFSDSKAVLQNLADFVKTNRSARIEYAQVFSPQNLAFQLTGTSISVNTRLAGRSALQGSIMIHNHPPDADGFADAFSRDDFRELFWGGPAESWLVAGDHIYRMSYVGLPLTPEAAVKKYDEAYLAILQRASETEIPIEAEQLEIMRWLNKHLDGVRFDEL